VRSPGPFFCSEILRNDPGVTAAERRVFDLARPFGILESYVLPHRAVDRRLYTVVLSGVGGTIDARLRVAANLLASSLLMAACRIEAATVAATAGTRADVLRPRQLECLEWSRRGKSSADIGKILGLSPRTVDEHIAAACDALDVRTRVQAVSQALAMGLLPYDPAEARSRGNP
jgi:DNA-binding CsgD family transcriptional regulator